MSLEASLCRAVLTECYRFSQFPGCAEPGDSRSTYSAFAISSILNDWSAVGVDSALEFLKTCQVRRLLLRLLCGRTNADCSVQKEASLLVLA